MSRWRPTPLNSVYVIGDIHGQLRELKLILNRILPLRRSDGGRDTLIMLGDYIDRRPESHLVIDLLIELKKTIGNNLILLRGNHEQMLLDALKPSNNSDYYLFWMHNGGDHTLKGYLERAESDCKNPYEITRARLPDFIPQEHRQFLESLRLYYETDTHMFVHAGCDPMRPLISQRNEEWLLWDRELYRLVRSGIKQNWTKTIITGHNGRRNSRIFGSDKYIMIDGSYYDEVVVMEANSRECFIARRGNNKLVKTNI